jgi:sulfite exporter TauE/SafE
MGVGTSLFLIAVGAVLKFAVHATARGFSIQTVGVILIIVGSAGLVISLMWMAALAERRGHGSYDDRMRTHRLS